MSDAHFDEVDLVVDLNSEDESGLPWSFLDEARDPSAITEGAWVVVGEGKLVGPNSSFDGGR